MTKPNKQEISSGPHLETKGKPSSAASNPTKSETENPKEVGVELPSKPSTQVSKKLTKAPLESALDSGSVTIQASQESKMRVPKPRTEESKRTEQAIARLKVKAKDLDAAPQITPTIKTCVKGGLKAALDAMRFASDDPEIAGFLKKYDSIPASDRNRLPWEVIAVAAKINTKHLLGSIQLAVTSFCATKSRFIAVSHHPATMRARAKYALLPSGDKDRTAHDIIVGAQASAKGPTFIGKAVNVFGAGGGGNSQPDDVEEVVAATTFDSSSDVEDRLFGHDDLDNKLVKIRQRLLED